MASLIRSKVEYMLKKNMILLPAARRLSMGRLQKKISNDFLRQMAAEKVPLNGIIHRTRLMVHRFYLIF